MKEDKGKKKEVESCGALMHKAKEKIKMLREATVREGIIVGRKSKPKRRNEERTRRAVPTNEQGSVRNTQADQEQRYM